MQTRQVVALPIGGYGVHRDLPRSVFVQTGCYNTGCPLATLVGQSYVSVSFAQFGVGESLFVNEHVLYIWAFVW